MKKQFFNKGTLSALLTFCSLGLYAQSSNQNYIQTRTPQVPVTTAAAQNALTYQQQQTSIQYYDGLGRPLQTVQKQATTNAKDIVQPFEYDAYGREVKKYLPYSNITGSQDGSYKTNALTAGQGVWAHYKLTTQSIDTTSFPFSETVFEASPLNRFIENAAPGKAFRVLKNATGSTLLGNTVKTEYGTNTATEVKLWTVTSNGATGTTNYAANQLYKTTLKDENWKAADGVHGTVQEFKDKQGKVVLKRTFNKNPAGATETLSTYYVYDDFGNLRYVLPPAVTVSSFIETDAQFKDLMYGYHYDSRQRVVEKKLPGKDWEYMVYNKLDQLVLSQDGNQRAAREWIYTKYDALGRVTSTGKYVHATVVTQSQMVAVVNAITTLWESRPIGSDYTNAAFPTSGVAQVYTVNYYDDYSFPQASTYPYQTDTLNTKSDMVRGLLTGTKVNVLGTTDFLWTVNYYDKEGRVIQQHSQNYVGGKDVINTKYSFTGLPLVVKRVHTGRNSNAVTVINWYEYDHMGRKKRTLQKINSEQRIILAAYDYNELGQQVAKKLNSRNNGSTYTQTVKYNYNIRGWLTKINDPAAMGTDKFGLTLKYDNGTAPQYNGNISAMDWKGAKVNLFQSYAFSYDKLNRLMNAQSTAGGSYNERIDGYDLMGNIQRLSRRSTGNVVIDSLTYTYSGNRLLTVEDKGTTAGFVNGKIQTTEYRYDVNGNMTRDYNAGLDTIQYNYLNLPTLIKKGTQTVRYVYDAGGRKLRRVLVGTIDSLEYANGIQYKSGLIDFMQTEEGMAYRNGTSPYIYRYNLTDHLGNVRVTVNEDGSVLQEDSYYAFGMRMNLPGNTYSSPQNKYLYNGKEEQDVSSWLDYGARQFDPTLGRWHAMDPLAEGLRGFSPYVYGNNNPVLMVDPDGMMSRYNWETGQYYNDADGDEKQGEEEKNVEWNTVQQEYSLGSDDPKKKGEKSAISNVTGGFGDGIKDTWEGIKSQFTLNGYLSGLTNTLTFGTYGSVKLGEKVFDLASNVPNYTAADYQYGSGYVFEKVVEIYLFKKLGNATKTGMSDFQLVTRAAQKAEAALGGTGRFAGTAKHTYANNLLSRYQGIYGDRGLRFNQYFNNNALLGPGNRGFLDVINIQTMTIYDYKFGSAVMSNGQFLKYSTNFPGFSIQIIKP